MSSETRKPLIIYHAPCADGFTAAWVAWKEFGDDAEYLPQGYSGEPAIPDVDDRLVYILDFCYPEPLMREIAERAETVILLDHHVSAQQDVEPLLEEGLIEGEFDMERSGAGIAWDWFNPGDSRPLLVDRVEDRDLYKFEYPDSNAMNIALFAHPYDFEVWDDLVNHTGNLLMEGEAILRKHMKDCNELTAETMYLTIGGHENIPTVNVNYTYGSDTAAILAKGHPFAAYFWMNKDGILVFGLRADADEPQSVDVARIAKAYGGGGHRLASGFRVPNLDALNLYGAG